MKKLLFVCMGNICRSPAAEATMNMLIEKQRLTGQFVCDSAGTTSYHKGQPADARMIEAGAKRGLNVTSIARPFSEEDFYHFDYVFVMDRRNLEDVLELDYQREFTQKVFMMSDFCTKFRANEIPDPYYGGSQGFEHVLDLLEDSCTHALEQIVNQKI